MNSEQPYNNNVSIGFYGSDGNAPVEQVALLVFPVLFICASVSGCGTGSAKPGTKQEFERAFTPFPENTTVSYLGPGGTYTEEDAQFFPDK